MFGHTHYVPVMRAKRAERKALRSLVPALRSRTTPLIECPLRVLRGCTSPKDVESRLDAIAGDLVGWSGRTVFLDLNIPWSLGSHPLEVMAGRADRAGIRPVPVISLKTCAGSAYDRSIRSVLERSGTALCLRLSPAELGLDRISDLIDALLARYGVSPAQVDLVVDRGGVDAGSIAFTEFAHRIPTVDAWRTLTVLSGSFPSDLTGLTSGKAHRLRRHEWTQWQDLESWRQRRPAFGDYTVQHVFFKEPVVVPNFSASVRYTMEEEFLVLRGEGVLNEGGPGRGQWNGWAALLTEMPEFFGTTFSPGDRYIAERAVDWSDPGTAQKWLEAAFSHHLTTTALQVAGRLDRVRAAVASVPDWTSVVDLDRPGASL